MEPLPPDGGSNAEADLPALKEETKRAARECLDHASDLVDAANLIWERHPHLAYHFAALALEEVGRSTLFVMEEIAQATRETRGWNHRRRVQDHVAKLFWALWGPSFGRERLSDTQIETFRGLAKHVNQTRQAGLYYEDADSPSPRDAINSQEAQNLIDLAEARIGLARIEKWKTPSGERAKDLAWFLDAAENPEQARLVMGARSMEKLAKLGSVPAWINWLRVQFERSEQQAQMLTERELARPRPSDADVADPKWEMKIRLESASHSIRSRPLQSWNGFADWIKLHPAGRGQRQLSVHFTLPKAVSIHALWWTGFEMANKLVAALNIASMGFFWWEIPGHISRFYDDLVDLETREKLVVERSPQLRIDWGNQVLSERILRTVALCFGSIPHRAEREMHAPFDHYLTGLAYLGKTDVLMQFEANSLEQFYRAFREASRAYGRWDGQGPFEQCFNELLIPFLRDEGERGSFLDWSKAIETGNARELRVDLSDVAAMKVLTDAFLIKQFRIRKGLE